MEQIQVQAPKPLPQHSREHSVHKLDIKATSSSAQAPVRLHVQRPPEQRHGLGRARLGGRQVGQILPSCKTNTRAPHRHVTVKHHCTQE